MNQRGFTLLEILIAVVVLSVGLLGLAALQNTGTRVNHSAQLRSLATQLAYDMLDRMRANQAGVRAGYYHLPSAASNGCYSGTNCTPAQLAAEDIAQWRRDLAGALPDGQGVVCRDSTPDDGSGAGSPACDGSGTLYAVKIWWTDEYDKSNGNAVTKRFVTSGRP